MQRNMWRSHLRPEECVAKYKDLAKKTAAARVKKGAPVVRRNACVCWWSIAHSGFTHFVYACVYWATCLCLCEGGQWVRRCKQQLTSLCTHQDSDCCARRRQLVE